MERLVASDYHEPGSRSVYKATDTASTPTDDRNDILISIRWDEAYEDLPWDSITMKLEVGDSLFDCAISDSDCLISQDGDYDDLWETNEFLIIMESDVDIVGASGANVMLYILYRGNLISGTSEVFVQ